MANRLNDLKPKIRFKFSTGKPPGEFVTFRGLAGETFVFSTETGDEIDCQELAIDEPVHVLGVLGDLLDRKARVGV